MSKVYDGILFANCWEDPSLDREAFQIDSSSTVFTITSGGCNALALLLDDPKAVVALDINKNQNYLLELKIAAFRRLSYPDLLAFFGVRPSTQRIAAYHESLRSLLSEDAQGFWDKEMDAIRRGIIHSGSWERYLRMLRRAVNVLVGPKKLRAIYQMRDRAERASYYTTRWMTLRWRFFLRVFLSRRMMAFLFDKAFFAQLESDFSFGKNFERKIRHALTELVPPSENPYLCYHMFNEFREPNALPLYLREANFETIRNRLDRISMVSESCESYFAKLDANHFSHFNFTNIFEWLPMPAFEALLRETARVGRDEAVLTYRNMMVTRSRPASLAGVIHPDESLAARLGERDLAYTYNNYRVERIAKPEGM